MALHHQVEPLAQDRGALLRGLLRPVLLGALGGKNGGAGFRRAELRHGADDALVNRVGDVDGDRAPDPLAVDVAFLLEQGLVLQQIAQRLCLADIHFELFPCWRDNKGSPNLLRLCVPPALALR